MNDSTGLSAASLAELATSARSAAVGLRGRTTDPDEPIRFSFLLQSSVMHGPNPSVTVDFLESTGDEDLRATLHTLWDAGVHRERPSEIAVHPDESVTVTWITQPERAVDGPSETIGDVTLAKPRRKVKAAPVEPLTDRVAPNDLDQLRKRLTAKGFAEGSGFTEEQIAATEKRRGVTFPPELRLFFSMVKKGVVLGSAKKGGGRGLYAEVRDGLRGGLGAFGNVVDPNKRALSESVLHEARPEPRPDDIVQPLLATKYWVVFADDGGGNSYALDLAPGPQGAIGQVVQFDHETYDPPERVATSLTAFLQGEVKQTRRTRAGEGLLRVNRAHTKQITSKHRGVRELQLGVCTSPPTLAPIAGAPQLTSLTINDRGFPTDPEVLLTFEALTYLSAPVGVWDRLLTAGHLPGWLQKGTLEDSDDHSLAQHVDLANRVLTHYGRPAVFEVEQVQVPSP